MAKYASHESKDVGSNPARPTLRFLYIVGSLVYKVKKKNGK